MTRVSRSPRFRTVADTVTAKELTRQKENVMVKRKGLKAKRIASRQKEKPHGKRKRLTAKRITSTSQQKK